MNIPVQAHANSDLANYSRDIAKLNAKPLWERTTRMGPGTAAVPAIWRYQRHAPAIAARGRAHLHPCRPSAAC